MNGLWKNALIMVVGIALIALAAGAFFGWPAALALVSAILLACLGWHLRQIDRLARILDTPDSQKLPEAPGLWGEIWYRLDRLIRRWDAKARETEQQHTRFIAAIQASPNGVMMLDRDNRIEWCNRAAELHFGLNAHRDRWQQVTHLLRRPEYVSYLLAENFSDPLVLRDADNSLSEAPMRPKAISVQIFPFGEARKLQLSYDISALESAEAMRRDFVANVSHELKSPLTILSGFLETVHDLPLSEDERGRYLEIMQQQAHRMQRIVEDLLTLAKLENPAQLPAREVIEMPALLDQLVRDAENLSQGRHTIRRQCTAGYNLIGDETEIRSALGNLVANAVHYTPAGGSIEINWTTREAPENGAVFSVYDNGAGIEAKHLPRLTERFYRIDSSRSRDTGGTGLGLAIVKHVLVRHDSALKIESGPHRGANGGQGSCFSARFAGERLVPADNSSQDED